MPMQRLERGLLTFLYVPQGWACVGLERIGKGDGYACRGFRMKRQRNMPTRANRIRIVGGC